MLLVNKEWNNTYTHSSLTDIWCSSCQECNNPEIPSLRRCWEEARGIVLEGVPFHRSSAFATWRQQVENQVWLPLQQRCNPAGKRWNRYKDFMCPSCSDTVHEAGKVHLDYILSTLKLRSSFSSYLIWLIDVWRCFVKQHFQLLSRVIIYDM